MRFSVLAVFGTAMAMWKPAALLAESCGRISKSQFPDCEEIDDECFCGSNSYLKTVAECIVTYSNGNTTDSGDAWDHFLSNYCDLKNALVADRNMFEVIASNSTYQAVGSVPFLLGYRAMYNHLKQKDCSAIQGAVLTIYWLAIPFAVGLCRLFTQLSIYLGTNPVSKQPNRYHLWLQKHLMIPALFRQRHMQKLELGWFKFSNGTRFETLLIAIYLLLTVVFMLCPYTFMDLDPFYDTRWKQMMRYGSDRSGIMATIQFPLLVLFATRNNVLIWVTGWPYATFNRFHRAISRTVYILLAIHSIMKHLFSASYGASLVLYFYPIPYYRYGVAAMFLFAIMIFFGSMRHRFYELFLYMHIACAFGGLIMSIFHLDGIGYQEPLYICLGFWGADILVRFLRIFVFNFSVFLDPIIGHRKVTYSAMKVYHQELTSISVKLPVKWHYYPGQYVYLHDSYWTFLTGGHPFSVVGENREKNGLELVFRGRGGFTHKLKTKLMQLGCTSELSVTAPIYIEGPYGVAAPVEQYGEVILFAGGIGITGILGYVEKLTEHDQDMPMHKIKVVWCVPKRDDFKPFARHIYRLQKLYPIEFQLFCRGMRKELININLANILATQPALDEPEREPEVGKLSNGSTATLTYYHTLINSQQNKEDESNGASDSIKSEYDTATCADTTSLDMSGCIYSGRPNIPTIIEEYCRQSQSSVCVVSCGPPSMVDQIRSCVSQHAHLARHGKVAYFEEAFEW